MNNFSLELTGGSIALLIAAVAVGIGLSIWTYRHTIPRTTTFRRRLLMALRSAGLALIILALFSPILSILKVTEMHPIIALTVDGSTSMQLPHIGDDTSQENMRRTVMDRSIKQLIPTEVRTDSSRVMIFSFADSLRSLSAADAFDVRGSVSDLSAVFAGLRDKTNDANIGAIVLYSDGAYTSGANPVYAAEKLGIPVFVVGLGDSSDRKDVSVGEIFTNEVATVGVRQPVDVSLRIAGVQSGTRVPVAFYVEGEKVDEQSVLTREDNSDYELSFTFTPKREGMTKLTVRAEALADGEVTENNNTRLAYVKVLKNTFKIVLFAGAPSSDVSFIRSYYQGRKEVNFISFVGKQGADFYEGAPSDEKVRDADLIILVGYPISATSPGQISLLRRLLISDARPLLFIPSRSTDIEKLKQIEDALPFVISNRVSTNEIKVSASLLPGKDDDPVMRTNTERGIESVQWESLAPLIKTETNFAAKPESDVLAEASIQGVKLGQPLILSRRIGRTRQIAFTGYGLWQWKLTSFGREMAYESLSRSQDTSELLKESALDVFLGNSTRWLVTHDDMKRVRISPSRKFYDAGERIEFTAQVYDESFVPSDGAIVTAHITGDKLQQPLDVTLEPLAGGRYSVRLPQGLPAGDYVYTGEAKKDSKSLGTDGGRFNVGEFSAEFAEPRMRADVLRSIAERTGGKFYVPEEAGSLMRDLKAHPRFQSQERSSNTDYEARNSWQLLMIAVVLLATEWFIRKRTGML